MSKSNDATQVEDAEQGIPQYALDHAPLLYLFSKDPYHPSHLATHLSHTHPEINFSPLDPTTTPLTLANLATLNDLGAKGGEDVYLTSNDDVSTNPAWLGGVAIGQGEGEKTCVIVVVNKEGSEGIVDVFYLYFFSFNMGGVVLTKEVGDHVGDWEHNMIRFENGIPKAVWLSQHANGEAYTFECLEKDGSGKRPVIYVANGSHALYPTPGTHDHTIPNLNLPTPLLLVDECDAGPVYDPVPASYIYNYTLPTSPAVVGSFNPLTPNAPVSFLLFTGWWGDEEYPENDPRQKGKGLFGFKKYVGGPSGPAYKQLGRKEVWPENEWSKGQRIRTKLPITGGTGGTGWWGKMPEMIKGVCFGKKSGEGKGVKRVKVSGEVVE